MKKTEQTALIKELIDQLYSKKTNDGISSSVATTIEINTLKSLLDFPVNDSQIIKTLVYTPDIPNITVDEFKSRIRAIQRKEHEDDKKIEWQILIPLTLKIPLAKIVIHDTEYQIVNKDDFKEFNELEFFRHTIFNDYFLEPKVLPDNALTILKVNSFGRDFLVAWNNLLPSFNILRGIIDYAITSDIWTYDSGRKCRSRIPHPKFVFGLSYKNSKRYLEFLNNPGWDHKKDLSMNQKTLLNTFLKALTKTPAENSIESLLSDSFRLYSYGMDELTDEFSFLRFWQLAERICFPCADKTNNDNISARLNFFSKAYFIDKLESYINSLTYKRNELVHHGLDYISEDDLNFLKTLCEKIILWTVTNRHMLKTKKHLDLFLKTRDINDSDLKTTESVLKFLQKYRNNK